MGEAIGERGSPTKEAGLTLAPHPSLTLPIKGRGPEEILRRAALCATLTLAAVAALITARRLSGALSADLAMTPLLAALVLASVIVFGGRAAWRRFTNSAHVADARLAWSGTAALILLCLGCAPPRVDAFGWMVWLPVIAADFVSRTRFLAKNVESPRGENLQTSRIPPLAPPFEGGGCGDDVVVVQELTRVRDAAGIETVRGTLRADFAVGQRHAMLYAGFCPPLVAAPDVEFAAVDGPEASVKVVQALTQGVELELRLPEPADEPCSVTVEIVAAPPSAPLPRGG